MSWKCQRRPSALHSLMGEGKSGNSQGHSTASNSCGLVNYNSEISTGTNRELGKDANVDSYPLNWFIPKWGKSCDGMSGQRYSHKYKTCPGGMCDHDDMTVGGVRNGVTGQRRGKDVAPDDEAHVILHQDFYSQSGTETNACTSETYVPEEDERSHALHVQSARTEAGGDDVITSDGDLQENPGHFPIEDQEEVWRRQVDVGNPSPQYTCTAAENCAEHCPNAHKYVGGSCAETRESSSRTTDAWRSSQPRAVTSSLQRGSPAPLMSARSSFDGADKHGPDCYQMPIVGHQSASDHSLNVRDSPGSKNNVRTNGIHRNFDLDVSSNGGGGGRGNAGADGRVPSDNRGSRTSWRQNLQCCSATSSPGEPNYFDAGSSRTSNSYRSHRKSGKNTGPQYVMYMPDTEKDISKKKKKVRKNKQQQLQNHGTADTDNNMAKYSPLLSMACNKDYNVGKCTENGVKSGPRGTCLSAHTSRPPSQKPNHGTAPDSPSSTPIPESQHLPKCSEEKSLAPRGAPPSEKTQPRACKKGESTSFSGKTPDGKQQHGKKKSSRTASKGNASHQSLPHKHAMVDKSVHMRYFQQSMADGKTYVCKSNSLVELSQAQMEDVRALESAGPTKRRSLTPKQEEYMLFHGERGNCLLHSYHQQHYRHRSDSRPVYPEHGQYDSDLHFPPLLSLEKYLEGGKNTTGPKFEEDFTDIVLIENRSGANKLRTESRDWQEACDEETGVLLAEDSEEDKNRDSLSSAKNSGDLESGFHSQA
ncbi:uncharacterized protein LOC101858091 [Aplysia californica]|uniref:Uncharacterized protein LOC101858091 n=1 Tax=Aplysia californica TaxID=6500 RepID=A0ABM0ZVF6_APLCA|nr:uncharacterized protein LOC101858091 [Aplysia californica]